jgi:VanZ family protein
MAGTRFFKYWLPVLLWMAIIFSASTDLMSSRQTSRFIGPFLRWFKSDISDQAIRRIQMVVRKGGHMVEFGVLAGLVWRARRKPVKNDPRPWIWQEAMFAILFCALYAVTDEIHQYFVATRQASALDVLWDSAGAVLGLLFLWRIGLRRKIWTR